MTVEHPPTWILGEPFLPISVIVPDFVLPVPPFLVARPRIVLVISNIFLPFVVVCA